MIPLGLEDMLRKVCCYGAASILVFVSIEGTPHHHRDSSDDGLDQ